MAKRKTYLGSVSLTALTHKTIVHEGVKGIFIPVGAENPAIYFSKKEDGTKVINLDIEVKPTPNNQYGNAFMVKANVGKVNRQTYGLSGEALNEKTPILGNLKEFEFEVRDQNAPAGEAPREFQNSGQPQGGAQAQTEDW